MPIATVNGYRIHYETAGSENAPAVILIHGVTLSLKTWQVSREHLKGKFRVVALDLLGHGESEKPQNSSQSIAEQGGIVIGLMDTLGIDRAALVGHSMGGQVALWIASHHPERIEKVAAVAAVTEADLAPQARFNFGLMRWGVPFPGMARVLNAVSGLPYNPLRKPIIEVLYYVRPQPESVFREIYDEQTRMDNYPCKVKSIQEIYRYRALDDADKLKSPLLIVAPEQDRVVPAAQALKDRVPGAKMVVIENCGHMIQYDAPQELNIALTDFLE